MNRYGMIFGNLAYLPELLRYLPPETTTLIEKTKRETKRLFIVVILAAICFYLAWIIAMCQIPGMMITDGALITFQPLVYWTAPILFACLFGALEIVHWTLFALYTKTLKRWETIWVDLIKCLPTMKLEDSANKAMLFTSADIERRSFLWTRYFAWFGGFFAVMLIWSIYGKMRNYQFYATLNTNSDAPKLTN